MADVKHSPFRRVSLQFYKTLRQSAVFPLIIGMRHSQVSFVLTFFRRNSLRFYKRLRLQLMALKNKFIAMFPLEIFGENIGHVFLTQNLLTTPGASYVLDFWLASSNQGGTNNFFAVSWDGGPNLTSLTNASDSGYTRYMFDVTASTTTSALQFEFFNTPGAFFLDDVSVEPAGVGVPDAGSTLPLLGFASLGLVALRRKLGRFWA